MARATDDTIKAQAIADLLAGMAPVDVATKYGVNKSTVSRWGKALPAEQLQQVATKKKQDVNEMMSDCLRANLLALQSMAEAVSDHGWLRTQSADNVGQLFGIITDKSVRIAMALQALNGNSVERPGDGTPAG